MKLYVTVSNIYIYRERDISLLCIERRLLTLDFANIKELELLVNKCYFFPSNSLIHVK